MTKESLANAVIEQVFSNRFVEMKASNTKTDKQTISVNFFGKLGVRVGLTKSNAYIELPNRVLLDDVTGYGCHIKPELAITPNLLLIARSKSLCSVMRFKMPGTKMGAAALKPLAVVMISILVQMQSSVFMRKNNFIGVACIAQILRPG